MHGEDYKYDVAFLFLNKDESLALKNKNEGQKDVRRITAEFPAPFPSVTPTHIAGPKPGLDGTGFIKGTH